MILEYILSSCSPITKLLKTYRNPIIYAQELAEEMKKQGLTQAELARKHGLSTARVNQWISILKLPKRETERILAMGDFWNRQIVTERELRYNQNR